MSDKIKNTIRNQSLNLRARQAVYALAALIDRARPAAEIVINADDLLNFIDRSASETPNKYEPIHRFFFHLNQHPLLTESADGTTFSGINWLSYLEIRDGKIHTRFSPCLTEYFLDVQSRPHTRLLEDLRPYKSKFTTRIIALFDRHVPKKNSEFAFAFSYDLAELKKYFAVEEKYKRFFDFERFVLAVTQTETEENDILPYWFSFEKLKKGRNIKEISFTVYTRPKVLLDLRPQLSNAAPVQRDIFDEQRAGIFDKEKQIIFEKLTRQHKIGKAFAQKFLGFLNNDEACAYLLLVDFGFEKTAAFSLLQKMNKEKREIAATTENILREIKQTAAYRKNPQNGLAEAEKRIGEKK